MTGTVVLTSTLYDSAQMVRFVADRPECLEVLNDRQRRIFISRHSECNFQRKTFAELGKEYGVSPGRVRQILGDAERQIRAFMRRELRKCQHCNGKGWT